MNQRQCQILSRIVLVLLFLTAGGSLIPVLGQCGPPRPKPATSQDPSRNPVFCPVKSVGQLCDHGTAAILKLKGEKRAQWYRMVQEYNRAVQSAQDRFVEQARSVLPPVEYAQVQKWFAARQVAVPKLQAEASSRR